MQTIEALTNGSEVTLAQCTNRVINLYQSRGFQVVEIRGDSQFKCIEEHIPPTHLYTCAPGKHVSLVERSIQTLEGDCWTLYHGLLYKHVPTIMLRSLVQFVVQLRNVFPPLDGISNTMSPTTIVTGLPMPNAALFSLQFGEYMHVHDKTKYHQQYQPSAIYPRHCSASS